MKNNKAINYKKKYVDTEIEELKEINENKNVVLGRRTGNPQIIPNGNDFLLQNNIHNILNNQAPIFNIYSSDSSSSSSSVESSGSISETIEEESPVKINDNKLKCYDKKYFEEVLISPKFTDNKNVIHSHNKLPISTIRKLNLSNTVEDEDEIIHARSQINKALISNIYTKNTIESELTISFDEQDANKEIRNPVNKKKGVDNMNKIKKNKENNNSVYNKKYSHEGNINDIIESSEPNLTNKYDSESNRNDLNNKRIHDSQIQEDKKKNMNKQISIKEDNNIKNIEKKRTENNTKKNADDNKKMLEEEQRKKNEEERIRKKAEEDEKKRKKAEEDEKKRLKAVEEEKKRKKAEEDEKKRLKAEEEERKRQKAEDEKIRKKAEEEERKRQKAVEEERKRQKAVEEERKRQKAEEEERKKLEEDKMKKEVEERRRREEEDRRKYDDEKKENEKKIRDQEKKIRDQEKKIKEQENKLKEDKLNDKKKTQENTLIQTKINKINKNGRQSEESMNISKNSQNLKNKSLEKIKVSYEDISRLESIENNIFQSNELIELNQDEYTYNPLLEYNKTENYNNSDKLVVKKRKNRELTPEKSEDEDSQKTKHKTKRKKVTENTLLKHLYNKQDSLIIYHIPIQENYDQTFGNGRYPKRNRIPVCNRFAGEKPIYKLDPITRALTLSGVDKVNPGILLKNYEIKEKKRRLKKGLDYKDEEEKLLEEVSTIDKGTYKIISIPSMREKSTKTNYQVSLACEILQDSEKFIIKIDDQIFKNLNKGEKFKIDPNVEFSFHNYGTRDLKIKYQVEDNKNIKKK